VKCITISGFYKHIVRTELMLQIGVGDNEGQNLTYIALHFFFDNWDVENMN